MTPVASNRATAPRSSGRREWRLGARPRKWTLLLHIASAGVWLGLDVVMGVLIATAVLADSERTKALCYIALELFAVWSLLSVGLICLASGVLLGLGSKYGLIRYWWVAVKLVLNIVLTLLVLILLRPGIFEIADRAHAYLFVGVPADLAPGDLIFPPIVSTSCVLFAMALSVFKPWGRVRRQRT